MGDQTISPVLKELRTLFNESLSNKRKIDDCSTKIISIFTRSNHQRCPTCLRVFKYKRNYKKHLMYRCKFNNTGDKFNRASKSVTNTRREIPVIKKRVLGRHKPTSSSFTPPLTIATTSSTPSSTSTATPTTPTTIRVPLIRKAATQQMDEQLTPTSQQTSTNLTVNCNNTKKKFDESIFSVVKRVKDKVVHLWKVKQENAGRPFKGSPGQLYACPHCNRGFTQLASFWKHKANRCPVKQSNDRKMLHSNGSDNHTIVNNQVVKKETINGAESNLISEASAS